MRTTLSFPFPLRDKISTSFESVINSIDAGVEARRNQIRLAGEEYVRFLERRVGHFRQFPTNRTVFVPRVFTRVLLTQESSRLMPVPEAQVNTGLDPLARAVSATKAIDGYSGGFSLLGSAGSGKTTILSFITLLAARGRPFRGAKRIALFFSAPELATSVHTLEQASIAFLERVGLERAHETLHHVLRKGLAFLVLDGLDEIPKTFRANLLRQLDDWESRYPNNIFCTGGRPVYGEGILRNFVMWEPLPLRPSAQNDFVRRWFLDKDVPFATRLVGRMNSYPEIREMGGNPLLLSLLCAHSEFGLDVINEEAVLFDSVARGLLGNWDAYREIVRSSPLNVLVSTENIMLFVSALALAAINFNKGLLPFTATDLDSSPIFRKAFDYFRIEPIPADIVLQSLCDDFGIVSRRSRNHYSFAHIKLHQFLVAHYAKAMQQTSELTNNIGQEPWRHVIVFAAKLIGPADDFLDRLHARADSLSIPHLLVLSEVWATKPMCSAEKIDELAASLLQDASTTLRILEEVGWRFTLVGGGLAASTPLPKLPPPIHHAPDVSLRAECLPIVLDVVRKMQPVLRALPTRVHPTLVQWASIGMPPMTFPPTETE